MKWIAAAFALLAAWPLGAWLRSRPAYRSRAWTLVGLLPFLSAFDLALVSFGDFPGDTHGFELALIDVLALALFFARRGPGAPVPFRLALSGYLLVAAVSVTQAAWPLAAAGYVWKLCRMYFLFAVICRAGDDEQVPAALLRGMLIGVVYEGGLAVWQRFGEDVLQVTGSFAHQNTLGTLVDLVVMVPIAHVVAGGRSRLAALAAASGLLVALLTVSRGALLFFGAGSAAVYLLSALRWSTVRKAIIGFAGLLLLPAFVGAAYLTIGARSAEEQDRSLALRGQYESAAAMMLAEHPLGVGPNHFTLALLTRGYGERAGVHWSQQAAIVHNVYWLTAAEMGYAGVAALLLACGAPLVAAFRYGFAARRDPRGDTLVGLGVGLLVTYGHGLFEWVWRGTEVSYVFWMVVAMVACLAREVRGSLAADVPAHAGAAWAVAPAAKGAA